MNVSPVRGCGPPTEQWLPPPLRSPAILPSRARASAQPADGVAHAALGAIHQLGDGVADRRATVASNQLFDPLGGLPAGAEHRLKVAAPLAGATHVAEDQIKRGVVRTAAIHDPDRRDAHALLKDLGRTA